MRIGALVGLILWAFAHAASAACTHTGGVTTWYVNFAAPSGGDGTSLATAFNSPYSALSANSTTGATQGAACAGDTILWFNNKAYTSGYGVNGPSSLAGLADSVHLGTSALPITIQGADYATGLAITNTVPAGGVGFRPSAALAVISNSSNFALQFQNTSGGTLASGLNLRPLYIVIKDVAFESTSSPNTLPSTAAAFGTTCGGTVSSSRSATYIYSAQNLTFQYDEIGCSGGGGFQVTGSDYITLDHSLIHDNAHYVACTATNSSGACTASGGRGSGISYLKPFDWQCDTVAAGCNSSYQGTRATQVSPGYTNGITSNFCFNNFNSDSSGATDYSDGECLILDRTFGDCEGPCISQDGPNTSSNWPNFTGRILVANNVVVGSGGPGFDEYDGAAPVDFINNTSWNNLLQSCPLTGTPSCLHQGLTSSGEIHIEDWNPPALTGLGINVVGNLLWTAGTTKSGTNYNVTTPVPFTVQGANCQGGAASSTVCFINVKNNILYNANSASGGKSYYINTSGTNPVTPNFVNAPVTSNPALSSPNDSVTADLRLSYDLTAGSGLFTGTTSLSCAGGSTTVGGDYCTPDVIGNTRNASFFGGAYAKSVNGSKGGGGTGSTVMGGGMIGMGCGEACASAAKFLFLHP